jgi:GTP pyrophosphokinase
VFKEQDKLDYKLSTCCNPIPGDGFGFVTINEGKVHKKIVQMPLQCNPTMRIVLCKAKWTDSSQQEFKAIINITEWIL